MHLAGCGRFWLWAVAGGFGAFAVVSAASIGIFVLPLAVVTAWLASRRRGLWQERLGTLVGAAAVCFLIAWLQREPGGFDSVPWLVAGGTLTLAGILGYALLAPRGSHTA